METTSKLEPSASDLWDWASENEPEIFEFVQFIPPFDQHLLFLVLWNKHHENT